MLSYLKSHGFGDAFLAGMRGLCVVTGLIGTGELMHHVLRLDHKKVLIDALWSSWNAHSGETNRSRANRNLQYLVRLIPTVPLLLIHSKAIPRSDRRLFASFLSSFLSLSLQLPTVKKVQVQMQHYCSRGWHYRGLDSGASIYVS